MEAIKAMCVDLHLAEQGRQIKKILELYEQLQQRMGVVIVGPSGSGAKLQRIHIFVLNIALYCISQ